MNMPNRYQGLLAWFCLLQTASAVPDPSTVPADLAFTKDIEKRFHTVVWVSLRTPDGTKEDFQYDRYPKAGSKSEVERVKRSEGVFARPEGKSWVRSDDWGATGSPVDKQMAAVLDTDASVAACPFFLPTNRDATQGGTVWRYVGNAAHATASEETFAESRERPKPDVEYPKFTFLKAPGDNNGRLFLCGFTANLRDEKNFIPVQLRLTYLVPIPAGSNIQIFDKDTGKEKLNTVIKPDSGFEIATQTSEPPKGP